MTDITDKIAALGQRFKVEPVRLRNGVQVTGIESDGSYKTAPTYTEYVTLASYERAIAERDLALEVLTYLLSAVKILHGQGPDCIIPTTVNTPIGVAIKLTAIVSDCEAVLGACGKERA